MSDYDNSKTHPTFKPLRIASHDGDLEKVISLVDSIQPDASISYLNNFLAPAAKGNHLDVVRYFLERGVTIGSTPLSAAAAGCSTEMLQLFMDFGWNINDASHTGQTILQHAANNISMVKWLLDKGADPNLGRLSKYPGSNWPEWDPPSPNSGAALDAAIANSNIEVFDLLLKHGAKLENSRGPLYAAIANSASIDMIQHLIEIGIDVNKLCYIYPGSNNPVMETPLSFVCRRGKLDTARFLLEKGAEPNKKAIGGKSALENAKISNRMNFVQLLENFLHKDENYEKDST